MTTDPRISYLSFGDFRLDCRSGELRRHNREIRLQPQPAKLLVLLATRRGETVTREEIQKALWGDDTFVDFEHGINFSVKQIRQALGDDADKPRYIETVPRVGYRFVARAESIAPDGAEEYSPYPGLRSFSSSDSAFFFGREGEIESVRRKLESRAMLGLMGPSGSGKSSFLKAGLIPSLPESVRVVLCTPGSSPMRALARALVSELSGDAEGIYELMEDVVAAASRWRKRSERALLVVDAFEELFTLNPPEVQSEFASVVGRLTAEADVQILLSMRDDFLFRCHDHEGLAPVFSDLTPLGPLKGSALRRALVEPALSQGYQFETEDLVDEMLREVEGERGALPLLAFAAAQLWEKRDREKKVLTRKAYEENGRVGGALGRHAEATIEKIGAPRLPVVRELFRNLVTAQGTRASREVSELLSVFPREEERRAAEVVLRELVAARLLTSYETSVEIIHESLLSAWSRLVRWQAQDADGALLRDQLRQSAQLWQERGRPDDLLWTGSSYRELSLWRERYTGGLSAPEESFADASKKIAGRRRRRQWVALASVLAASVAVAAVVSLLWREARGEALRAEASKLLALAELRLQDDPTEALAFATASLDLADTEEARVFVMKALWEAPPVFELSADSQGVRVPVFSPDGKWLATAGHATDAFVWSEDGGGPIVLPGHDTSPRGPNVPRWASTDLLVTGLGLPAMFGSRVHLWSLPLGSLVRTIDFGGPSSWQVGSRRLLAETLESGTTEQPDAGVLRSWALPDGMPEMLGRVEWKKLGSSMSFFEPNGASWIYARDRVLYSRPLPMSKRPDRPFARLAGDIADYWLGNGPDQFVVADKSGETYIWSVPSQGLPLRTVIPRPSTAPDGILRPDRSGRWLRDPNADQAVRLWDLTAWMEARPISLRRSSSWYGVTSGFHPTGEWVAASTASMTRLTFWPLGRTFPTVVEGYRSFNRPLAFSPDGKWLATNWHDGRLRLWPLPGSGASDVRLLEVPESQASAAETLVAAATALATSVTFDPKGRYLFVAGSQDRVWLAPLDGSVPRKLEGFSEDTMLAAAAVSPSGRRGATAFWYGGGEKTLRVWDLETGELQRFELPESQGVSNEESATGYERGVASLDFADESTLYTAGDGGLRRWNLETGSNEVVAATSPGYGTRGSLRAERGVAIMAELRWGRWKDCSRARLYDLRKGVARELTEFGECPRAVALDSSGTVAATGSIDGIVRIGRLDDGEPHLLLGHKGAIDRIAISDDLGWVATTGEDNTLRLWPMPDLSKPPLHTLPHEELLAKLRSLTNLRAVSDPSSATGWKVEVGPFPGWKVAPRW